MPRRGTLSIARAWPNPWANGTVGLWIEGGEPQPSHEQCSTFAREAGAIVGRLYSVDLSLVKLLVRWDGSAWRLRQAWRQDEGRSATRRIRGELALAGIITV